MGLLGTLSGHEWVFQQTFFGQKRTLANPFLRGSGLQRAVFRPTRDDEICVCVFDGPPDRTSGRKMTECSFLWVFPRAWPASPFPCRAQPWKLLQSFHDNAQCDLQVPFSVRIARKPEHWAVGPNLSNIPQVRRILLGMIGGAVSSGCAPPSHRAFVTSTPILTRSPSRDHGFHLMFCADGLRRRQAKRKNVQKWSRRRPALQSRPSA